jgi:hypothetical protein
VIDVLDAMLTPVGILILVCGFLFGALFGSEMSNNAHRP